MPGRSACTRTIAPACRARGRSSAASPTASRFDGYRTLAEDGAVRHFSEQVVAAEGMPGWVGTITDYTDLFAARDDLRRAESLFRNTFDQAPIGIAHADRRGKILRCNQSFWTMLGYEPARSSGPQHRRCHARRRCRARCRSS